MQVGTAVAAAGGIFFSGVIYAELQAGPEGAVAAAGPAAPVAVPTPAPAPTETVTVPVPVTAPLAAPSADVPEAQRGAPPVQVTIPDLGIDQRLIGLRVQADGRLQVPESFDDIGWWSGGPAPGDAGAALMVGHVDSKEGPAVFYSLSELEVGDEVAVRRADGRIVRFAVTGTQTFPKDDFPDDLVYRTDGKPSLHLVTCGGTFDRETGHYRDNVVVFADLIDDGTGGVPPVEPPAEPQPVEPPPAEPQPVEPPPAEPQPVEPPPAEPQPVEPPPAEPQPVEPPAEPQPVEPPVADAAEAPEDVAARERALSAAANAAIAEAAAAAQAPPAQTEGTP